MWDEKDMEHFFELSLDMLCIADCDGYFKRVNPAWERTLGYPKQELVGRPCIDFIHPDDRETTMREAASLARGLDTISLENRYRCQDGSYKWLSWNAKSLFPQQLIYAAARDITEQKRTEDALRKSEERYKELLASITDYIYTVHFQNETVAFTSHGPGCLAVTGYNPEDYTKDPDLWYRMVHPDDRPAVVANAAKMAAGEAPPPIEHRIFHRDGAIRWVRNQRVLRYNPQGELTGYDGLVSDITLRKEGEEQVQQVNMRLRHALARLTRSDEERIYAQMRLIEAEKLQTVGRLASGVAHEVKNPLAVLQMGLGCLAKPSDTDTPQLSLILKEMGDAVNRANAVVGDLLDFAFPTELDLRETEIEPLIRKPLLLVRHELTAAKVKVATAFGNLPSCSLDENKIEQVLINLFTNACHAMPKGGLLAVTTRQRSATAQEAGTDEGDRSGACLRAGEQVVVIEIADTGSGISEKQIPRIFDPFFTTKPTGMGSGLGLTVTKTIIDLHGGLIDIRNRPEGGAVVTIVLKCERKDARL